MIGEQKYYSSENALKYMSASQLKMFLECESKALAEIKGEYKRESSSALLVGSYVDSYVEGTLDNFKQRHSEIFTQKGTLKAEFQQAEIMCKRISSDEMFVKYLGGEHQKIFIGNIAGVEFKGKLDCYHEGKCIVDLKTVKDFEPVWKNRHKMSFVEAWGYDIQGAIYQELVYQNTGEKLPFFICAITKEKTPDMAIISIPQERLDVCLDFALTNAPRYNDIKQGKTEPTKCCKCDYCKSIKKITEIIDYRDLNPDIFKTQTEPEIKEISVRDIVSLSDSQNPLISDFKAKDKKKKKKKSKKIVIKLK